MKILLLWAGKGPEMISLVKQLNQPPHQVIYWVGHLYAAPDAARELPGIIFHAHSDAALARPASAVEKTDFFPPSAELIAKLYRVESIILTMLNRHMDRNGVDERRERYYQLVGYWQGVLERYRPEVIIFDVEPHWVYDYLVYELAQLRGIKTFAFEETRVSDRLLVLTNIWQTSPELAQALERNRGQNFTIADLSPDLQSYYRPRTAATYKTQPLYIEFQKKKYSLWHRLLLDPKIRASLGNGAILKKLPRYLFAQFQNQGWKLLTKPLLRLYERSRMNLKKEYRRLAEPPDFSKKFIYAALQVQPERTTSPLGGIFVDQLLMIETLAYDLPSDWIIYVKEHPMQWLRYGIAYSSSRYPGYYNKIAELKNVRLVPVATSTHALINNCQAVATVTGSPGWEGLLRSKPVLIFGFPWYKECPGVMMVRSVPDCQAALARIIAGYRPSSQAVINYLKSFDEATSHGFIAPSNAQASSLSNQQSMDSIARRLRQELEQSSIT